MRFNEALSNVNMYLKTEKLGLHYPVLIHRELSKNA